MTTPKIFELDGINKVFPSDIPIKGLDYVVVYISTTGLVNTYNRVNQSEYSVSNGSIVFNTAPQGTFMRMIVGTNRAELLNTPSNIANVAVNMDSINFVADNIDVIIDSYNVIATAENIGILTIVGASIDAVQATGDNITSVDITATNIGSINTVASNITKVSTVSNNITNVNSVGDNIDNVNIVANNIASIVNMAKFKVRSEASLVLDTKTNPKFPMIVGLPDMVGFEVDIPTNSIKNVSGRDLDITGSMSVQITTTSTTDIPIYVYSEYSLDGTTWLVNTNSLRKVKIVKEGTDYLTIPSLLVSSKWLNGTYIRFRFYKEGAGDVTITAVSDTVGGNTITGNSFLWTIHEI